MKKPFSYLDPLDGRQRQRLLTEREYRTVGSFDYRVGSNLIPYRLLLAGKENQPRVISRRGNDRLRGRRKKRKKHRRQQCSYINQSFHWQIYSSETDFIS